MPRINETSTILRATITIHGNNASHQHSDKADSMRVVPADNGLPPGDGANNTSASAQAKPNASDQTKAEEAIHAAEEHLGRLKPHKASRVADHIENSPLANASVGAVGGRASILSTLDGIKGIVDMVADVSNLFRSSIFDITKSV